VAQTSMGIDEVSQTTSRSSLETQSISLAMEEVEQNANILTENSGQVQADSERLSALSDEIASLVGRFKV